MTMFDSDTSFYRSMRNARMQYSIHSAIVMFGFALGRFQTVPSIIGIITLELLYWGICLAIKRISEASENARIDEHKTFLRKTALHQVRIYLAPYKSIWRNLRLTNKQCHLCLGDKANEIIGIERVAPYRRFVVTESHVHEYEYLWNMFCQHFGHNTTYQGLVENCQKFRVSIAETLYENKNPEIGNKPKRNSIKFTLQTKVDINNCSEMELTELPGINVILAKKIVKRREEIKGFKSTKEFYEFTKLKPHFQEQLNDRIEIKKKRHSIKNERYQERNLDL